LLLPVAASAAASPDGPRESPIAIMAMMPSLKAKENEW
jgi:hypothetical protein